MNSFEMDMIGEFSSIQHRKSQSSNNGKIKFQNETKNVESFPLKSCL